MKNEKVSLQIRIEESIYSNLKKIAKDEMRSVNAQLEYFLRDSINEYLKKLGITIIPEPTGEDEKYEE